MMLNAIQAASHLVGLGSSWDWWPSVNGIFLNTGRPGLSRIAEHAVGDGDVSLRWQLGPRNARAGGFRRVGRPAAAAVLKQAAPLPRRTVACKANGHQAW